MPVPVSLVEIVESGVREGLASVHTSHPGQVVAYYPSTQTADVKPLVKRVLFDVDGGKVYEDLPIIPNVPVQFPRGSGYTIYVPLGVGDFVWLIFSEASTGEVRTTGQVSEPLDSRRHSLAYPVAIPGAIPDMTPLADVTANDRILIGKDGTNAQLRVHASSDAGVSDPNRIQIGLGAASIDCKDGTASPAVILIGAGASDFVALASKVDAAIENVRSILNSHQHSYVNAGGSPTPTVPTTPSTQAISGQASTAATVAKAK